MIHDYFVDLLRDRLQDELDIVNYIKDIPLMIQYYLLKSLYYTENIILAKPYSKYAWMLTINTVLSKWRGNTLIVYYNEREPRYTVSLLIQELVGKALMNDYGNLVFENTLLFKTLSHLASFISNYRNLYREEVLNYISQLYRSRITISEKYFNFLKHDLVHVVIPRILAYRLVECDYRKIVEESLSDFKKLFEIWLDTKPPRVWIISLSNALKITGYNPVEYGLVDTGVVIEKKSIEQKYVFIHLNEVDEKYVEMMRILRKAIENRDKLREVLKEWWSEISDLEELELIKHGLIIPDVFAVD